MLKTTRRGLFSFLAAALAWLIGRRASAAPAPADCPSVARVLDPMPNTSTMVYCGSTSIQSGEGLTTTLSYDAGDQHIVRPHARLTTYTYDAGGPLYS